MKWVELSASMKLNGADILCRRFEGENIKKPQIDEIVYIQWSEKQTKNETK